MAFSLNTQKEILKEANLSDIFVTIFFAPVIQTRMQELLHTNIAVLRPDSLCQCEAYTKSINIYTYENCCVHRKGRAGLAAQRRLAWVRSHPLGT